MEIALGWVFEGAGFESTYAGVPSDTFVDGYDVDFATNLAFDLTDPASPAQQQR
ncbi:MAG: hypothetical protein ABMB14_07640 [Myxococcota bacterium]